MKNVVIVLFILILTGCASTGRGIDTSSNCKYTVDGLECNREQVWQMRDRTGNVFKYKHTYYWFEDKDSCEDFLYDRDNEELIASTESHDITWCGSSGEGDSSADVTNYYIYTDGNTDGEFFYKVSAPLAFLDDDKKEEEWFYALFTSKTALKDFQWQTTRKQNSIKTYSTNHAVRIKVKRMY